MSPETCPICTSSLPEAAIAAPDRLHGTEGQFELAICSKCGAGVTLPRVDATALTAFYPTDYAAHSSQLRPAARAISAAIQAWQGARERRRPPLNAVVTVPPGRGIDVGCGRGDIAAMLIGRGWHMSGVEPSRAACEVARARGIYVQEGVLATVELEAASYDAVIFRQSLEHTDAPVGDLRRAHSALRSGGMIAISVPNFGGWQRRRFGACWYHLDLPRHRTHFTADTLRQALETAGFGDVRITTSTSAEGLWASLQYRLFGRCVVPQGLPLRVALATCVLGLPLVIAADRAGGGGDLLHAVARKPS